MTPFLESVPLMSIGVKEASSGNEARYGSESMKPAPPAGGGFILADP